MEDSKESKNLDVVRSGQEIAQAQAQVSELNAPLPLSVSTNTNNNSNMIEPVSTVQSDGVGLAQAVAKKSDRVVHTTPLPKSVVEDAARGLMSRAAVMSWTTPTPTTIKEWDTLRHSIDASLPPPGFRLGQAVMNIERVALKEAEVVLFKIDPVDISVLIMLLGP
jgi:hypothetical protein